MANAVVMVAVKRLADFLIQEVKVWHGLKENFLWLKDELGYIQSFLKDVEQHQSDRDNRVKHWISDVRDVATDITDVLDQLATIEDQYQKPKLMDRVGSYVCICREGAEQYKIGQEMESIKQRVLDISRRREVYGIGNIVAEGTSNAANRLAYRRQTSYADEDQKVVGFEDVTELLLGELVKEEPERSVVAIHGMGGLGKTTLARKLYNSSKVQSHFRFKAWVCVSKEYSIQDLLQTIIKSLTGQLATWEKMNENDLERCLRGFLERERYLIVVDDVWHREAWESLRRAFPNNSMCSRIIMTTRNKEIATRADDRGFVHQLRFLFPDESWELLRTRAFRADGGEASSIPLAKEKLGKEMVEKCRGLPLAISVLGGHLLHNNGLDEWIKVRDHIWGHLKDDCIEIPDLLSLSYHDLSPEMQQCFLYFGFFPEDCKFEVDKLIRLWIAEEFIPEGRNRVMEDAAMDYLKELINRNLIQVASTLIGDIVYECHIHDLLLDLAIEKATETNFLGIFDPRKPSDPYLQKQRRHAIHSQIAKYLELETTSLNFKVRSLIVVDVDVELLGAEQLNLIYTKFKYLKVLDLMCTRSSSGIGSEIGHLVNLKFLGLTSSKDDAYKLPPTIGKLKRLQSLYGGRHSSYIIPKEISELKDLRHMYMYSFTGHLHIDSLTNLQTLHRVMYNEWIQIDTLNLINIRDLHISSICPAAGTTERNGGYNLDSVSKLVNLHTLFLSAKLGAEIPSLAPLSSCQRLNKIRVNGRIGNPSALSVLPHSLTILMLVHSKFTEDPMPTLERLPNLTSLELYMSYEGKKLVCSCDGFEQLVYFLYVGLGRTDRLEEWQVEEGAMPMLRAFTLQNCYKLKVVPKPLISLPPLSAIGGMAGGGWNYSYA